MNFNYPYFDAHSDTLTKIVADNSSIGSSRYSQCLPHLKKYKNAAQVFAIYNDGRLSTADIFKHIEYFKNECHTYSEFIALASSNSDIAKNISFGKASALLSIEGLGNTADLDEATLPAMQRAGVMILSLCHNDDNILCGGIENNNKGISPVGRRYLRQMQALGLILDISHMSDISFWEATSEYSLPPMASHSNSRSVCAHKRNLTDSQFVYLTKRGGVCGLNFNADFVSDKKADINAVIRHIEHFMSLGGENSLALGSDFDGLDFPTEGLENAGEVYRLFDKLLSLNYNENLINKIAFNNFHNFLVKFEALK